MIIKVTRVASNYKTGFRKYWQLDMTLWQVFHVRYDKLDKKQNKFFFYFFQFMKKIKLKKNLDTRYIILYAPFLQLSKNANLAVIGHFEVEILVCK